MPLIDNNNYKYNMTETPLNRSKINVFERFNNDPIDEIQPYSYNDKVIENKYLYKAPRYIALALVTGLVIAFTTPSIRYKLLDSIKKIAGNDYQLINPFNKELDMMTKLEVGAKRLHNKFFDKCMNLLYNIDHLKNHVTGIIANKFKDLGALINKINTKLEPGFFGAVTNAMKLNYEKVNLAQKSFENELSLIIKPGQPEHKTLESLLNSLKSSIEAFTSPTNLDKRIGKWFQILEETSTEYKTQISNLFKKREYGLLVNKSISFSILNQKKMKFTEELFEIAREISFSPKNKVNLLKYIQNEIINGSDVLIEKFLPRIKKIISEECKSNNDIISLIDDLYKFSEKPQSLNSILKISKEVFNENKLGHLERLIKECDEMHSKGKISDQNLISIKESARKLTQKLQNALDFEIENMTGRMLDLKIGPTPFLEATVLAILPLILLKTMINKEDCFEEKVSKAIKYTPPIVGGLWGVLFSLKKGIFGAKAVLFGVGTGWVFHKLGNYVDEKFYTKGRELNIVKSINSEKLSNTRFNIQEF